MIRPIVGIFDAHVPDHDPRLWSSWLDWCRDEKPAEVIIGGDFLELESCSEHGGVARPALFTEEIAAGKDALADIRRTNPTAKITYLEGNHETRLRRKVVNRLPDLDGAVTLPDQLELRKLGVSWHKYGDVVRRGKLGFTHGWWTNDHHAAKHLRKAKCSIAYGHTHRPQMYSDADADGDVIAAFGMPCMRKLRPEWLDGQPVGWMQGFGVFYVHPDGRRFSPYMVLAFEGAFVWSGKGYGGKKARAA
jgi:predicted phosphodiesterase